ncbi:SDR family oxidoreductase [Micromonospora eburnea]|uniref:NAD(P)-dependent dehydrogenase, short-chain alcohol dehydrogenase family n=1 Tax=Micromonospora eburnea TaxID=227316 RepID=A0A1C6TVH7_9ACTN|nr:SDR family oxidoreductase [Micromonospora eburnea]SCL45673.1 NAD(P)-dependent dehydrogenase, short-chain alcohol dehydrogenase family [Micromonospora eburnea]
MTTTIALVTGANRGIGLATARQFGARGWTVLVGARDAARGREAERALRAEGADARFVPLDVTDAASVAAAAELVERAYGHLDVLVNNAGIIRVDGSALPSETTLGTLREVFETNVFGVVAVTNAFLPLLRKAPAARIVNVSSEVGSIAAMTDPRGALFPLASVPYPSSKTALNMVTAMYAKELRDTPIKVNAANPGYCATDFNGHAGFRTAEEGAEVSVHLATLPADGPSGLLWGYQMDAGGGYGTLPW